MGTTLLSRGKVVVGSLEATGPIVGDIQAAAGTIGATELAEPLDLSTKTVTVASQVQTAVAVTITGTEGLHILNNSTAGGGTVFTLSPATYTGQTMSFVLATLTTSAGTDVVKLQSTGPTIGGGANLVAVFDTEGDGLSVIAPSVGGNWAVVGNNAVTFAATT